MVSCATHLMPGDNVLGLDLRNSRICCWLGWIMFRRSRSASWNVIDPFIASFVNRATSWPLPQNCANSSMPSSRITVESTSKHTTFEFRMIWAASEAFFDLSPLAVHTTNERKQSGGINNSGNGMVWWIWWIATIAGATRNTYSMAHCLSCLPKQCRFRWYCG